MTTFLSADTATSIFDWRWRFIALVDLLIVCYGLFTFLVKLFIAKKLNYIFVQGHKGFTILFTVTPIVSCLELVCLSVAAGFTGSDSLNAMTIISVLSLALNAVFFAWFPQIYSVPQSNLYLVGSWLLWSVACSLGLAYTLSHNIHIYIPYLI